MAHKYTHYGLTGALCRSSRITLTHGIHYKIGPLVLTSTGLPRFKLLSVSTVEAPTLA